MLFTIEELENGLKKVTLQGRLDNAGTHEIDVHLSSITAGSPPDIIIDLSGVDYITSVGIGLLVRAANILRDHKRTVVLMKPKPMVFRVLEAVRIEAVTPIVFDIESALGVLKERNFKS